jgi:hypothetical protein
MYQAIFINDYTSEYYGDNELLFIVKRKKITFIREKCDMYKDNDLIFSFYQTPFMIFDWKLEILVQRLEKNISLKRVNGRYYLLVDNNSLTIKFTNNPLKKTVGKIYCNQECIGEIKRNVKENAMYFLFTFYENAVNEYYVLILFSMFSVGITDSP